MSYFNDGTKINNRIIIDGVPFYYTSEPIHIVPNHITEGARLADSGDFEGKSVGVKHEIKLKYAVLNKEHFDYVRKNTIEKFEAGREDMFFNISIPAYDGSGSIKEFRVYLGASSLQNRKCTDCTEHIYLETGNAEYDYGGSLYDERHENIELNFVEK